MNKAIKKFLWIVLIGLMSLSMGCALLTPPKCHPEELIPDGRGGFVVYPDPCAGRP